MSLNWEVGEGGGLDVPNDSPHGSWGMVEDTVASVLAQCQS